MRALRTRVRHATFVAAGLTVGIMGASSASTAQSTAGEAVAAPVVAPTAAPPVSRAPASTRPVQLRAGDVVKVYIWREPELSRDYEVNGAGSIDLPKIGQVDVTNVSPDSLQRALEHRFARYVRTPTIEVSMRQRISVLGSVRNPGVYQVDPYVTVADALALAGGPTPDARTDDVHVLRGERTLQTRVSARTVIADSPVESGDQLYVPDRGWVSRNLTLISAGVSAVGILVFALRR